MNRFEDNNNNNNKYKPIKKYDWYKPLPAKNKIEPLPQKKSGLPKPPPLPQKKGNFNPIIFKKTIPISDFYNIMKPLEKKTTIENQPENNNTEYSLLNPLDKINNLDDLIKLSALAKEKESEKVQYILPVQRTAKIYQSLLKLQKVIGLDDIKNQLIEQIIYLVSNCGEKDPPMLHTVIEGPPGTGKTKIAKIIGEIISEVGYLQKVKRETKQDDLTMLSQLILGKKDEKKEEISNKPIIKYVTRSDLVGGFLGQTAMKTQKAIDEATGGVLIIDEAYSLGGNRSTETTDSYSQECIDTLVSNLSENRNFVCIVLGYSEEINNSFIAKNKGLESRFPFRYSINKYGIKELVNILKSKIQDDGFEFESDNIFKNLMKKNIKEFKYYGRDMEILWFNIKMAQSKRVFFTNSKNKSLDLEDVDNGIKKFLLNRKSHPKNFPNYFT